MEQYERLEKLIKTLDSLLEAILYTQFGIEDKEWIDAISTIEDGYAKARNYISRKLKK
ncbi:MAG: hypothetical protein ACFFDF_18910 [Candidatus Odinarchaeota archaeon]